MASPASPARRPVPSPSNPVLLASQAQWLFTDDELTRTPSQLDGMKFEAEHTSRSKGVNFITQVGIMLKLPQLTIATAAVYLHRFFMRYSIVDIPQRPGMHPYPIAATSLFLATKVEENVRKMRELVVACCRVGQKNPNMLVDEQSKEFWKWRDTILHHEDLLLETLCFDLQLEQPYRLLYDFICFFGFGDNKALRNASWAFVNDSMFTVLCLQFHARTIAAAALYAAARHCEIAFEDDDLGRPWWEQIDVDLTQMRRACSRLAQLYENNASQKHSQNYPTTPVSDEGQEKTRRLRTGTPGTPAASQEAVVNGRKRSREPEEARGPSETPNPPVNGQRSPKRQRLSTRDDVESNTPPAQPPTSISYSSHGTTATTDTSYHDRQLNGHRLPHSRNPHPPPISRIPQQHQHQHQQNHRPFPRRHSHAQENDPVQHRIDQIVNQNQSPGSYGAKHRRSSGGGGGDHYRPRERDRRLSSHSHSSHPSPPPSSSSAPPRNRSLDDKERHPDLPSRDKQPPPPPPPPPPQEDDDGGDGGGSEEGELV